MHRSEMGQGVHTALAMLAAEELDVPLARVRLIEAGARRASTATSRCFVAACRSTRWTASPATRRGRVQGRRAGSSASSRANSGINATGGSSTVADAWEPLRLAAATARAQLLGAASLHWRLPVAELTVEDGVVRHASGSSGARTATSRRRRRPRRRATCA